MKVCWEVDAELSTFSTPLNIFKVTVYQTINNIETDAMNCTHTFYMEHNYIIQQNSFTPIFHNSEILIIHSMQVPEQQVLLCIPPPKKKASSMKQADLSDMITMSSKSVCISTVVVSPDPLSPTSPSSSAILTS